MNRGMGNMQQLLQQAKQMQKKMEEVQKELATRTVDGAAGGGAVKVVMTGKFDITSVTISPEVMKDADAEMLADMVKGAFNEALKKAQDLQNSMMGGSLGNVPLPPGLF